MLVQLAGAVIVLIVGADIFYTVLFPASGHGPLRRPLSRWIWHGFRLVAARLGKDRQRSVLSYSGPVMIAVSIAVWTALLVVGWALIFLPALGTAITASSGNTARGFAAAFYFSGFALTTLGMGDIVPHTGLYQWLTITEAVIGFATVSLVITYFMSVYGAITERRTFGAMMHHRTDDTGDSIELIVTQAFDDDASAITSQLSSLGEFVQRTCETHRSYPVLRYFHFRRTRYSLPRMLLLGLDSAALLATTLDPEHYRRALRAPAVTVVSRAADELLHELVPRAFERHREECATHEWRLHYLEALRRVDQAGLHVRSDVESGVQEYVDRRRHWDTPLRDLAAAMLYEWAEIEPDHAHPSPSPQLREREDEFTPG